MLYNMTMQALVSDQEAREEVMPPSPAHDDLPDDSNQRETNADDVYEPISLTEDVLKMHNLLQEQYYLQKVFTAYNHVSLLSLISKKSMAVGGMQV